MLELLFGIGVILVAVQAAFSSGISSSNLIRASRETDVAMADLASAMEQILVLPPSEIPIPGSPFEAETPIAAFDGLHLNDERVVATYPDYTPGGEVPDPLEIVLTLTWIDFGGRERDLVLSTVKTR